ncbi:Guanosine-diphosphatase [Mycoemilia scoparia]|uniref:Guanosine-diphosphatase n=1 Tax=Mycoemilia scoparia TaxID=417184 RepID=A0A9W7ZSR8_9FUNG|nr:Guanosine-diphosphatase [Mycoemilia scoparia]
MISNKCIFYVFLVLTLCCILADAITTDNSLPLYGVKRHGFVNRRRDGVGAITSNHGGLEKRKKENDKDKDDKGEYAGRGPINKAAAEDSFEDNDPTGSSECQSPSDGQPLVQYAVVMDAGSQGTRIHIYKFNYCSDYPQIESDIYTKDKTGLSTLANDPQKAAEVIEPLLKQAMEKVPQELHKSTPITLRGTAGLRLIEENKRNELLQQVRDKIQESTDFLLDTNNNDGGVIVMSGEDEGLYEWWALNYVLENLKTPTDSETVGIISMGGASTQFVFQPPQDASIPQEYKKTYRGPSGSHDVYAQSYLGFGKTEARSKVFEEILSSSSQQNDGSGKDIVYSTCFDSSFSSNKPPTTGTDEDEESIQDNEDGGGPMTVAGTKDPGDDGFQKCYDTIKSIFRVSDINDIDSNSGPDSVDSNIQFEQAPSELLPDNQTLFATSKIYDMVKAFKIGPDFTPNDMKVLASKTCQHDKSAFNDIKKSKDLKEMLDDPYLCVDTTFIYALLIDGLKLSPDRTLHASDDLNGFKMGWAMGAAIDMLLNKNN